MKWTNSLRDTKLSKLVQSLAQGLTPVIPAVGRLRQEDHKLEANLGCAARLCLKQTNKISYLERIR
jgi:hypothetical protein